MLTARAGGIKLGVVRSALSILPLLPSLLIILWAGSAGSQPESAASLGDRVSQALRFMGDLGAGEPLFDPLAGLSPAERELTRGLLATLPPSLLSGRTLADIRRLAAGALARSKKAADRWGVEPGPLDQLFFLAYPTALDEPAQWPPLEQAWQEVAPRLESVPLDRLAELVIEAVFTRVPAEEEKTAEPPFPPRSPWPGVGGDWCARRGALAVRLLRRAGLPGRVVWTGPVAGFPRGYTFSELLTPAGWRPLDPCGRGIGEMVRTSGAVYRPYPSEWALALSPYLALVDTSTLAGFSVELATADYREMLRTELVEVELGARGPHGEPLHQFRFSLYGTVGGRLTQVVSAQCRLGSPCRLLVPPGAYLALWQSREELFLVPAGKEARSGKEEEGEAKLTSLFLPLAAARRIELRSGQRVRLTARLRRGDPQLPGRIWLREVPR